MADRLSMLTPRIRAGLRELEEVGTIMFSHLESDFLEKREEFLTLLESDVRQNASNPKCAMVYCALLGISSFENTYDRFSTRPEELKSEICLLEIQEHQPIEDLALEFFLRAEVVFLCLIIQRDTLSDILRAVFFRA
jgi:hypothetical protein